VAISKSFYITNTANFENSFELYDVPLALTYPVTFCSLEFDMFYERQANNVVFPAPFPLNK
jgi:hypothetical protein